MKFGGFSLIECILVIGIATTCCVFVMPGVRYFVYIYSACTTMQQLQQSISLARSMAIARNSQVYIYLQGAGLTIKLGESDFIKHLSLNVGIGDEISLQQSGFSNKNLTIQADGMTYTNGHFNYKSQKSNSLPQFNLYFNRALRTYILVSG